ncbi:MAG TPA: BBP7 family outer membrane beta-barrel protein [Fimbriiglobus sp.]|jgi:hypothetical protein
MANMPSSYLLSEGWPIHATVPAIKPAAKLATAQQSGPADKPAAKLGIPNAPGNSTCLPCVDQCNGCAAALCCVPCGPPGRVWFGAEWIYWKTSGQYIPPLVTTAPVGVPQDVAGTLGKPSTTILAGGQNYNDEFRSGFRITGGVWLDECNKCGIEADFLYLGASKTHDMFHCDGTGNPPLFRPFTNALTGLPDTELVCFPDVLRGAVTVDTQSELIGGGVNFVKNLCCNPCGRFDLLVGYRYLSLTDEVAIHEDLTVLSQPDAGTHFQIEDRFRTENHFNGGVIGFNAERRYSHYYVDLKASVALGNNHQIGEVAGSQIITNPSGVATSYPGGLLAMPSNIGRYEQNRFCVVPEVGLKFGVQVTEHARAYIGYNYLYMSNVLRAGDQIDLRVNTNQIPPSQGLGGGPALPAFPGKTTSYSAHGVSAGFEFRF